jgi:hypothetical protein
VTASVAIHAMTHAERATIRARFQTTWKSTARMVRRAVPATCSSIAVNQTAFAAKSALFSVEQPAAQMELHATSRMKMTSSTSPAVRKDRHHVSAPAALPARTVAPGVQGSADEPRQPFEMVDRWSIPSGCRRRGPRLRRSSSGVVLRVLHHRRGNGWNSQGR